MIDKKLKWKEYYLKRFDNYVDDSNTQFRKRYPHEYIVIKAVLKAIRKNVFE